MERPHQMTYDVDKVDQATNHLKKILSQTIKRYEQLLSKNKMDSTEYRQNAVTMFTVKSLT